MMISARASRCVRWPFSCFSLRTSSKSGSRLDWGPRWRGARPRSRCWRQGGRGAMWKAYRRGMAPIAPGALAESASAKMRFLYSAEYWRRLALTTTSGSGIVLASPGATLRSASLRSASLRSAPGEAKTTEGGGTPFTDFFMSISFSALYTKSRKGRRLTDLGTEGVGTGNRPWRGSKTIDHNWVSFYTRDNVHQKRSTDSKTLRRAPIVHPQVAQRRVAGCEGTRCFARIPAHKSVGAQRGIVSDALPVFQTFPVVALRALHARDPFLGAFCWKLPACINSQGRNTHRPRCRALAGPPAPRQTGGPNKWPAHRRRAPVRFVRGAPARSLLGRAPPPHGGRPYGRLVEMPGSRRS